jgi:hypothetical protein
MSAQPNLAFLESEKNLPVALPARHPCPMLLLRLLVYVVHLMRAVFRSRSELVVENLALRQSATRGAEGKEASSPCLSWTGAFWIPFGVGGQSGLTRSSS